MDLIREKENPDLGLVKTIGRLMYLGLYIIVKMTIPVASLVPSQCSHRLHDLSITTPQVDGIV